MQTREVNDILNRLSPEQLDHLKDRIRLHKGVCRLSNEAPADLRLLRYVESVLANEKHEPLHHHESPHRNGKVIIVKGKEV